MTQLERVKSSLGVTGSYQDETIQTYIDEVKQFLLDAGAAQDDLDSSRCDGILARGVADLWNYGAGGAALSPYFLQRAIQICSKKGNQNG